MNPDIAATVGRDMAMVIGALVGFLILGFIAAKALKLVASVLFDREQANG